MKNQNIIFIKKSFFLLMSFFLILDILFIPFVTEPFIFENGISEQYIFGSIMVIMLWVYFVWLNFTDLRKNPIHRFEDTILFAKSYPLEEKKRYYFHLNFSLKLITIGLSVLILLGIFSIVNQYELLMLNFHSLIK